MPKHQALPSKAQKNQAADAGCAKWSKGFHAPNYIFEPAPAISEQAAPDSRHASFQHGVWKEEEGGGRGGGAGGGGGGGGDCLYCSSYDAYDYHYDYGSDD